MGQVDDEVEHGKKRRERLDQETLFLAVDSLGTLIVDQDPSD